MMPILVKGDDVRRRTKAEAHHAQLLAARESMGYIVPGSPRVHLVDV